MANKPRIISKKSNFFLITNGSKNAAISAVVERQVSAMVTLANLILA